MNVHIWNKVTKHWIIRCNVDYIVTNVSDNCFKLDGKEYDTNIYEINFVHSRDTKPKDCSLWKKLPNGDCSECPNANEDCIMLG